MIKALIFDFGDVFINLDKEGTIQRSKEVFGKDIITEAKDEDNIAIFEINNKYEKGEISTHEFISFYTKLVNISETKAISLWNSLILNFPLHRLDFIKTLAEQKKYKLILLSNTNELHINHIKEHVSFYNEFKACFDAFYLSHEIGFRKPNANVYEFVLAQNNLNPEDCFFIDDTVENTESAKILGINTWHINPKEEDITQLFTKHQSHFE